MGKKSIEKQQAQLEEQLDALDGEEGNIADLSPEELEEVVRTIRGNSMEAFKLRRARKEVRYKLYRIQTEKLGKFSAEEFGPEFRAIFEGQPHFKGWRFFADLWDVSIHDPYTCVARDLSAKEEWEAIIRSKFPRVEHDDQGRMRVVYPDIKVKEAVEKAKAKLEAKKSAEG